MAHNKRKTALFLLGFLSCFLFVSIAAATYSDLTEQGMNVPEVEDLDVVQNGPFPDVPTNHRNYPAIEDMRQRGLIQGYDDGTFRPAQLVTRAEAAAMIVRALQPENPDPDPGRYKNCFADVTHEWFAKYVCFGKSKLWLRGYYDTQDFRPGSNVIIAEFLRMVVDGFDVGAQAPITLYKYKWDIPKGFKNEPKKFPGTQWWETYMVTARFWNFIDVTPLAGKMMSRGEVAEIIHRVMIQQKIIY